MKAIPLSCADFTFPLLPLDAAFQLVALLGVEGVDIGVFQGRSRLCPEKIKGREKAQAGETVSHLSDLGLKVSDVFIQTGCKHDERSANHPVPKERQAGREVFLSALEFAVACQTTHMSGLPGMSYPGVPDDTSVKLAAEESSWRTEQAASAGLVYSVEAHVGSIIPTPKRALDFVRLGEKLSLTLDYGHFVHAGFSNEAIHPLLAHASHFHARGGAPEKLQAVMKENIIDFAHVARELQARNYPGWICLEYVWIDWEGCNRADNVSETILLRDLLQAVLTREDSEPRSWDNR